MNTADISFNLQWLRQKPTRIALGEDIDYYNLFRILRQRYSACYMFESLSLPRHQDRYFTIGFDPILEFAARGDTLAITGTTTSIEKIFGVSNQDTITITGINPYEFIKANIPMRYTSGSHQGGLIGYFSYEAANYFEPAIDLQESADFATFRLGLFVDGVIFDSVTGLMTYYTFGEDRSDLVRGLIDQIDTLVPFDTTLSVKSHGHNMTRAEHASAVERMLEEIRAGNTFQGEVGFKTKYEIKGDKFEIYDTLRQINPSPYMFYTKFGDEELMGASPELLVTNTGRTVLTTPTAGTIGRSADPIMDARLARQLLSDPKEIAEHRMLVDLHRNDIARVCRVGSVNVSDLMYIIKFSHVQHIVSNIQGELSNGATAYDLLAAIMPGGVLTGAPKIETIKIIAQNEKEPRGPYGGAVGRFAMNGDSVFCLSIRSLFCKGDNCFTQTSSGIVIDSTPAREYEEVQHKLGAMEATIRSCVEGARDDSYANFTHR